MDMEMAYFVRRRASEMWSNSCQVIEPPLMPIFISTFDSPVNSPFMLVRDGVGDSLRCNKILRSIGCLSACLDEE